MKEVLQSYADLMSNDIANEKQDFVNYLDGTIRTLVSIKSKVIDEIDDSTEMGSLNPLGILQRQGQIIESYCMSLVTKVKHLSALRKIIADSEKGE